MKLNYKSFRFRRLEGKAIKMFLAVLTVAFTWMGLNAQVLSESFDVTGLPSGWTQEYVSGTKNWSFGVASNGNATITPQLGSGMAEFRSASYANDATKLITPELDLTALTTPQLTFRFANVNWGGDIDALRVYYKTDATAAWTQIGEDYVTAHTDWEKIELQLPNPSSTYFIAFEATSGYARGLDLDNVTVGEAPTCLPITNLSIAGLTTTTADISWLDPNTAGQYVVVWGAPGFDVSDNTQWIGSNSSVSATNYQITGLSVNTNYDVYVVAVCDAVANDASDPVLISIATLCDADNIPYTVDFESVSTPSIPSCTSVETLSGNAWKTISSATGFNGKVLNVSYNSSQAMNTWFYTNGLNLIGGQSYRLSFKYGNNSTFYTEKMAVVYGTSATSTDMTTQIFNDATILYSVPKDTLIDFTPAVSGVYYIGFNGYSDANQNQLYLDDIHVDVSPEQCAGTPDAGIISGPSEICAGTTLTLTGTEIDELGVSYRWESSTDNGATWTAIAGADSYEYITSTGIDVPTSFRMIVTCTNSNFEDTTNVVGMTIKEATECYCTPVFTSGCGFSDLIDDFSLSGDNGTSISDLATGCNGYEDKTALPAVDLTPFMTYQAMITTQTSGDKGTVWIDFNNDGQFSSAEVVAQGSLTSGTATPLSMTIPSDVSQGAHRMRVMVTYSSLPTDGCTPVSSYGETHDYMVTILPVPDCESATMPTAIQALASSTEGCQVVEINFSADQVIQADVTYQWQSSANGTDWTNVGAALEESNLTVSVDTTTIYRLEVLCHGNVILTSNEVTITMSNPGFVATQNAENCGPGELTLGVTTTPSTTAVNWYDEANNLVGTGNSFTTPTLSDSTIYYAQAIGSTMNSSEWIGSLAAPASGSNYNPFYNLWETQKLQALYTASELQAMGFSAGEITSIALNVGTAGARPLANFNVKAGLTTATAMTNTLITTGLTDVYSNASYTPTVNDVNVIPFSTPIEWDGTSNVVIEFCYANDTYGSPYYQVSYTDQPVASSAYQYVDGNLDQCTTPTGSISTSTKRVDLQFTINSVCKSDLTPVYANVNPIVPPVITMPSDFALCAGMDSTLTAGNDGATYLWSNGSTDQTITVDTAGTYNVSVTGTDGCSATSSDVVVTINENPVVDLGTNQAICQGDSILLSAGNGGVAYEWSNGSTNETIMIDTAGTYNVAVTDANGCSTISSDVVVTMNENPVVDLGTNQSVCEGATVTLNAGNDGATYLWSNNATSQTVVVDETGTYHVTVTDTNNCTTVSDDVDITVNPLPQVTVSADKETICVGKTANLTAAGASTYSWSTNQTGTSITVSPETETTYTVTGTSNGCSNEATITIHVDPCLGVNDTEVANVIAYPNPANAVVTVSGEGMTNYFTTYSVVDVTGRTVMTNSISSEQFQIDVKELVNGVYFVNLSGNQNKTFMIEVKH